MRKGMGSAQCGIRLGPIASWFIGFEDGAKGRQFCTDPRVQEQPWYKGWRDGRAAALGELVRDGLPWPMAVEAYNRREVA